MHAQAKINILGAITDLINFRLPSGGLHDKPT
jgi:hypothetical protein